jgi:hypothetical protein
VVHVDHANLSEPARSLESEPRRCELDTARRLACDASVVGLLEGEDGEPLDIGRKTRSIPPALGRALRARDGGCRFPGCDRRRFTEGHHVERWADGGETKRGNLVTLCGFHHRLVHEGGFGVSATDGGSFVFTRPDGRRVPANGARCFRGNIPGVASLNRDVGLTITPETSRSRWLGERLDYSLAIEGMQYLDGRESRALRSSPATTPL